jgi:hypothetical protein
MDPNHLPWHMVVLRLLKVLGIVPDLGAAYWLLRFFQKWRQQKAAEGWPSVDATFLNAIVHDQGMRHFIAEVTYSCFVDEYRTGKHLRHFHKDEDAYEFVRQIKDKRVHVHYDAANPDRSVILDRDLELIVLLVLQSR